MSMLSLLHHRCSHAKLTDPGPNPDQLQAIKNAALSAPDHALLRPWHFLLVEGDARQRLGTLFARAARAQDPEISDNELQRLASHPLRAPLIIVAAARIQDHPKVPEVEQLLSVGAAVQQMSLAASSLGYGAIWRTGAMAYNPEVKTGLGLDEGDHIAGFLYIGTPQNQSNSRTRPDSTRYFSRWE